MIRYDDPKLAERLALRAGIPYEQALLAIRAISKTLACAASKKAIDVTERKGVKQSKWHNSFFVMKANFELYMRYSRNAMVERACCVFKPLRIFDKALNPSIPIANKLRKKFEWNNKRRLLALAKREAKLKENK